MPEGPLVRPLVIAYDVVETLFALDPLGERLQHGGQSPELLKLAVGALRAVADLSEEAAREVVAGFATLDPQPDVAEAMRLAGDGDFG